MGDFGPPTCVCEYCGIIVWYEERTLKRKTVLTPQFSLCCSKGKIQLPLLKQPPEYLKQLLDTHNGNFFENIRAHNSMFGFTSMGVGLTMK